MHPDHYWGLGSRSKKANIGTAINRRCFIELNVLSGWPEDRSTIKMIKHIWLRKNEDFFLWKRGMGSGSGMKLIRIRNSDSTVRVPLCCRCNGTAECVDESDEDGCEVCGKETWPCSDNRVSLGFFTDLLLKNFQMANGELPKWKFESLIFFVSTLMTSCKKASKEKSRMEAVCYGSFFFADHSFSIFICSLFIAKFSKWKMVLLVTVFKSAWILGQ